MQAATAVAAPQPNKRSPTLMPDRIGQAEHKRHDWVVDVPVGVTVEDIQNPAYWALVVSEKGMEPLDHIEVRSDDGMWIAYLIVRQCERTYAKVYLDRVIEFKENMESALPPSIKHKVEFKGGHLKWGVIRLADSAVLQSGFKTREDADTWMRNHERTV